MTDKFLVDISSLTTKNYNRLKNRTQMICATTKVRALNFHYDAWSILRNSFYVEIEQRKGIEMKSVIIHLNFLACDLTFNVKLSNGPSIFILNWFRSEIICNFFSVPSFVIQILSDVGAERVTWSKVKAIAIAPQKSCYFFASLSIIDLLLTQKVVNKFK